MEKNIKKPNTKFSNFRILKQHKKTMTTILYILQNVERQGRSFWSCFKKYAMAKDPERCEILKNILNDEIYNSKSKNAKERLINKFIATCELDNFIEWYMLINRSIVCHALELAHEKDRLLDKKTFHPTNDNAYEILKLYSDEIEGNVFFFFICISFFSSHFVGTKIYWEREGSGAKQEDELKGAVDCQD